MSFWKTSCYKRKPWNVSTAAWGLTVKKGAIKPQVSLESTWRSCTQNWTDSPSISIQVHNWAGDPFRWIFFLWKYDLKKKGGESCSLTHSSSVLLIFSRQVLDFCEEKNILLFTGKQWTLSCSFQLLTHMNNLFLIQQTARVSSATVSFQLKMKSAWLT